MKQQFGLIRRPWGVFYLKNKITGEQASLKTRDKVEAQRLLQAHNESESLPQFNLSLARVYLNGADPKLATRTWQEIMEHIVSKKTGETRRRWEVATKDRNFDCIRYLPVAETRPGKLTPLGDPSANAPKWFAAVEVIQFATDREWLHRATREISKYWRQKRSKNMNPVSSLQASECEAIKTHA